MTKLRCEHCLLAFPERDAVYDDLKGERKVFCCDGCRGIYRLINEEGLDAFYTKRKWDEAGIPAIASLEKEIDIKPFTEHARDVDDKKEIDIFIGGIRCASCVWLNERILARTDGIDHVRVNYATHKAKIRWNPRIIGLEKILKRIRSIGYDPKPYSESEQFRIQKAEARDLLIRLGTAGFLSSQLMVYSIALYAGYFQGIDAPTKLILEIIAMILTIPVIFYSGMPFLKNTIRGLRRFHFTMDSLIAIGALSAFCYSIYEIFRGGEVYFDTSAMIITLILLGRYIEAVAKGKASETIEKLSELRPREARLLIESEGKGANGRERRMVPLSSLRRSDVIEVVPGEKIPLDGVVISGESEVDESIITGESKPVLKLPGKEVIGGSVNLYGTLIFEITRTGKETVLSQIIKAVEDAQAGRPRIQRSADRIVGYFVPLILVIALSTATGYYLKGAPSHRALMTGISVLVIACPCSLGLATPLAVFMFTALASSKGILIRGGEVIERASRVTHVIFDKTGTITAGKPSLRETVIIDPSLDRDHAIALAASLERLSEHSIGHAITGAAGGFDLLPVSGFRAIPGKGVEGVAGGKKIFIGAGGFITEKGLADNSPRSWNEIVERYEKKGDTVVHMVWDNMVRALFVISDAVRIETFEAVNELRSSNLHVSIVSGDNSLTTRSIASMVGIDNEIAGASPVKKKEVIARIQQKGEKVMMIGDGINDAPALTEAFVGVAMGRGTDIAMESADAVLVRNDLGLIPRFIRLSKKTFGIIRQNIFWAFLYNVVAIPLAVAGLLHPIIAAGAMAASSLFVVGNSLRIREQGKRGKRRERRVIFPETLCGR